MLRKVFFILLVMVFFVLPATAKELPPGKWWNNQRVIEKLQLTDEEISELDTRFVDSRRKLIRLKSAVESEKFELDNLLEKDPVDDKAIMKQFEKLELSLKNLRAEHFRSMLEVRKILGQKRFRQLKTIYKSQRKQVRQKRKPGQKGSEKPQDF